MTSENIPGPISSIESVSIPENPVPCLDELIEIDQLWRALANCDAAYGYMKARNAVLTEALTPFAKRVVEMGMPRAKVDKDDLWVSIGLPQSVWLNAAKALAE